MKHFDEEDAFHSKDRKQFRKQRRVAQKSDRSKFKQSNLNKAETVSADCFASLSKGRVVSITGEGAIVDFDGKQILCSLKGLIKKEEIRAKNLIAVGDWVRVCENNAIAHVEKRSSFLGRTDISGRLEQLIAVNVDQVMIVVSINSPPLKPALIDRYLIAAEKGNVQALIVVNKIDLLNKNCEEEMSLYQSFLAAYEPLGFPMLSLSAKNNTGIAALRLLLQNKISAFAGQSGVGKSSILNACFGWELKVGNLAMKTSKGTHTTSSARLIPLPIGGFCVDTPGVRSFGIWKFIQSDITTHFSDISFFAKKCKYPDCIHINEPECAVLKALESGGIASLRYESYLHLMKEIQSASNRNTWS